MTTDPFELGQLLRSAGLRVTAPRVAVLATLAERADHPDADAVAGAARARLGALSLQAVYDVLRVLVEAGLVRRTELAGRAARYEARAEDGHHHVVCRSCGAVADVDCRASAAHCMDRSSANGFSIDEVELTFWGYCPRCRAARREGDEATG